jgi:hypothetical protein
MMLGPKSFTTFQWIQAALCRCESVSACQHLLTDASIPIAASAAAVNDEGRWRLATDETGKNISQTQLVFIHFLSESE